MLFKIFKLCILQNTIFHFKSLHEYQLFNFCFAWSHFLQFNFFVSLFSTRCRSEVEKLQPWASVAAHTVLSQRLVHPKNKLARFLTNPAKLSHLITNLASVCKLTDKFKERKYQTLDFLATILWDSWMRWLVATVWCVRLCLIMSGFKKISLCPPTNFKSSLFCRKAPGKTFRPRSVSRYLSCLQISLPELAKVFPALKIGI